MLLRVITFDYFYLDLIFCWKFRCVCVFSRYGVLRSWESPPSLIYRLKPSSSSVSGLARIWFLFLVIINLFDDFLFLPLSVSYQQVFFNYQRESVATCQTCQNKDDRIGSNALGYYSFIYHFRSIEFFKQHSSRLKCKNMFTKLCQFCLRWYI